MNRSARTAETVSDVYLALMLSAFLLWTGPDGYTKILEAKYRLFLLLTIVYCAAAALSALRQIRTVCCCKLLRAVRPAEWLMLGYVLCSLLSTFLSPWRADAWLGLSRREGLLTLALYGAVFLLLGRLARPKAWLLDVFGAAMSRMLPTGALAAGGRKPAWPVPEGAGLFRCRNRLQRRISRYYRQYRPAGGCDVRGRTRIFLWRVEAPPLLAALCR